MTAFDRLDADGRMALAKAVKGHNRQARRAMGWRGPIPPLCHAQSGPSADVVHAICRSCRRQRQIILPARICGGCIESAMALASAMTKEQAAEMLAALDELEKEEMVDVS